MDRQRNHKRQRSSSPPAERGRNVQPRRAPPRQLREIACKVRSRRQHDYIAEVTSAGEDVPQAQVRFWANRVVGKCGLQLEEGDDVLCFVEAGTQDEEYAAPQQLQASRVEVTQFSDKHWNRRVEAVCKVLQDAGGMHMRDRNQTHRDVILEVATSQALWNLLASFLPKVQKKRERVLAGSEFTRLGESSEDRTAADRSLEQLADCVRRLRFEQRASLPHVEGRAAIDDLRFTHATISSTFKDGRQPETLWQDIVRGHVSLEDPRVTLEVVRFDGKLWSINNRRLWVFKMLQEHRRTKMKQDSPIMVPVKIFGLCQRTAQFLLACAQHPKIQATTAMRLHRLKKMCQEPQARVECDYDTFATMEDAIDRAMQSSHRTGRGAPRVTNLPPALVDRFELCPLTSKFLMACSTTDEGRSIEMRPREPTEDPGDFMEGLVNAALRAASAGAVRLRGAAAKTLQLAVNALLLPPTSSPVLFCLRRSTKPGEFIQALLGFARAIAEWLPTHATAASRCLQVASAHLGGNAAFQEQLVELFALTAEAAQAPPGSHPEIDSIVPQFHRMTLVPELAELRSPDPKLGITLERGRADSSGCLRDANVLPPVRIVGGYDDAHSYFDTYFRLLREDAIGGMRKAIRSVLRGSEAPAAAQAQQSDSALDGTIVEVQVGDGDGYRFAVTVELLPGPRGRDKIKRLQRNLMVGNLVALIFNDNAAGTTPLAWSLLCSCDRTKGQLSLEVHDIGKHSWERCIEKLLVNSNVTLVPSPVFFRAYEPVLRSLQTSDPNALRFCEELVKGHAPTKPSPSSASGDKSVDLTDFPVTPDDGTFVVGVSEQNCAERIRLVLGETLVVPPGCDAGRGLFTAKLREDGKIEIASFGKNISVVERVTEPVDEIPVIIPASEAAAGEARADTPNRYHIKQEQIGKIIGAKGKTINDIIEKTGARVKVDKTHLYVDMQGTPEQLDAVRRRLDSILGVSRLRQRTETPQSAVESAEKAVAFIAPGSQCEVTPGVTLLVGSGSPGSDLDIRYSVVAGKQSIAALMSTLERLSPNNEDAGVAIDVEQSNTDGIVNKCTLDPSQTLALKHILENRVAIIQGPPGTGKTFIGYNAVKALCGGNRILILTYKNHALDEFLKKLVALRPEDVVRVGGRADQELESRNLRNLKSTCEKEYYERFTSQEEKDAWGELITRRKFLKDRLQTCCDAVQQGVKNVQSLRYLSDANLVECLNDMQLHGLLAQSSQRSWKREEIANARSAIANGWYAPEGLNFKARHILNAVHDFAHPSIVREGEQAMMQELSQKGHQQFWPVVEATDQQNLDASDVIEVDDVEMQHEDEERRQFMLDAPSQQQDPEVLRKVDCRPLRQQAHRLFRYREELVLHLPDEEITAHIRALDLTELSPKGVATFVHAHMRKRIIDAAKQLNEDLQAYKSLVHEIRATSEAMDSLVLEKHPIVGMTLTGACINMQLLRQWNPDVILVEEAAEVLESNLLAVLTPSVKHLIMIGDHQQLPPQVDTMALRRDCNFDVSMLERLIHNGLPYKTLERQSRMHPDISRHLVAIYPMLTDNVLQVGSRQSVSCLRSRMFFWDCRAEEDQPKDTKSYRNEEEAQRVVALARFLIAEGFKPQQISILTAYQQQTKLVRGHLKAWEIDIQTQTIDRFQGDENDIILVSLVRSNKDNNPGYLGDTGCSRTGRNRLCVAQSRARCCTVFVGNARCLRESKSTPHWQKFLDGLGPENVSQCLPLVCPRHPDVRPSITCAEQVPSPGSGAVCRNMCGAQMGCGHRGHICTLPCHKEDPTLHSASACKDKVQRIYKRCVSQRHSYERECGNNDYLDKPCPFTEKVACTRDPEHMLDRQCEETMETVVQRCKFPCSWKLACGHECKKLCHEECTEKCMEQVRKKCPRNEAHELAAKCWESPEDVGRRCRIDVDDHCVLCEGPIKRKCNLGVAEASKLCSNFRTRLCPRDGSHSIEAKCSSTDEEAMALCKKEVLRSCPQNPQHKVMVPCNTPPEEVGSWCKEMILRPCQRGHQVSVPCNTPPGAAVRCTALVERMCPRDSTHRVEVACHIDDSKVGVHCTKMVSRVCPRDPDHKPLVECRTPEANVGEFCTGCVRCPKNADHKLNLLCNEASKNPRMVEIATKSCKACNAERQSAATASSASSSAASSHGGQANGVREGPSRPPGPPLKRARAGEPPSQGAAAEKSESRGSLPKHTLLRDALCRALDASGCPGGQGTSVALRDNGYCCVQDLLALPCIQDVHPNCTDVEIITLAMETGRPDFDIQQDTRSGELLICRVGGKREPSPLPKRMPRRGGASAAGVQNNSTGTRQDAPKQALSLRPASGEKSQSAGAGSSSSSSSARPGISLRPASGHGAAAAGCDENNADNEEPLTALQRRVANVTPSSSSAGGNEDSYHRDAYPLELLSASPCTPPEPPADSDIEDTALANALKSELASS